MKYLEILNERNKENKARKNKAMDRSTTPTGKPGKHSTDGSERGRRERPATRARNVRIRPGETRDVITKGKTGKVTAAGRLIGPNRPFADLAVRTHTAGPKGKLPEHIEYKRMAALMAESLGYRVDEFIQALAAPAAAALRTGAAVAGRAVGAAAKLGGKALKATAKGTAKAAGNAAKGTVKAAGNMAKDTVKDIATDMAEKRAKKMAAERMEMEEAFYFEMGMLIAEVTKKVGPIASRYSGMGRVKDKGKGKGAQAIGDPVVRKAVRGANERVSKKLGIKANLATDVAAQQGLENRRRRFRKQGKGLPAMTRKEREADARQDVERRKGPDDK